MSDIGKKLLKAAKRAPTKIREYVECRHVWLPCWNTRTHSAEKCHKCGTLRVQRDSTP